MGFFTDKVAIVTGGASGIGRGLCEELGQEGAKVVVTDLNGEGAEAVAKKIKADGGWAMAERLDVTQAEAVQTLVDRVVREQGRLDYMFNNAGIAQAGEARDKTVADWNRVLSVNLLGVIHGVAAAYPVMVKQGFGHIVNTGSVASFSPLPFDIAYTTAKHAVMGLSLTLRAEGHDLGVKVSVTCPGLIDTAIYTDSQFIKINRAKMLKKMPRKMLSPEKCARAILRGVKKNRMVIPVTPLAWIAWWLVRFSPSFYVNVLAQKTTRKFRAEFRQE